MSVRSIEAEVSIKSGVQAECTIGREVIVEVHEEVNLESLTATANGEYTPAEGVDGYSDVTVAVPERIPVTESLSVTENGTYEPDTGVDGYDRVVVDIPPTIPEIEALTVTEDGTYTTSGDGYNPVTVSTGVGALRQEIQSAKTASGCDPLTDGLTALITYANEVTGQEDTTLSDAVETLASWYGKSQNLNAFKYLKQLYYPFQNMIFPETTVVDFEGNDGLTNLYCAFRAIKNCKHIIIKNLIASCTSIGIFGFSDYETITFEDCDFKPTAFNDAFRQNPNLTDIVGDIDLSECTNATNIFHTSPKLKEFRIKKDSIGIGINGFCLNPSAFSNDTWVSVGNALRADSPNTIQIGNNNRTIVSAILGNNVDGTFIADENGSMTLMDFITQIKGWTVT